MNVLFAHAGLVGEGARVLDETVAGQIADEIASSTMEELNAVSRTANPVRLFEMLFTNGAGGGGHPESPSWTRICEEEAWTEQLRREGLSATMGRCEVIED